MYSKMTKFIIITIARVAFDWALTRFFTLINEINTFTLGVFYSVEHLIIIIIIVRVIIIMIILNNKRHPCVLYKLFYLHNFAMCKE